MDDALSNIMRELEETVEAANLLALTLAIKSLEDEEGSDCSPESIGGIRELAGGAAHATEEFERLMRRLQAA